ncbi:LolA-like outer membrane lipoprotein chaperone [Helicobacter sp. 11S02629-2]|uniref:LolA-like outer membrane lipoprotein chaperone n=1 Tax=Helicobacter sp. 11S02629-2 TaxID=1476195 RepID=UPI000BA66A93|nr:LolA-like outer membrane lipoprotein chaperone [Helicobacter sp. 11S02629-2]PAF44973.1 hypothetical protein BKH40_04620 [Helicobacter sp. 11S02629-2]
MNKYLSTLALLFTLFISAAFGETLTHIKSFKANFTQEIQGEIGAKSIFYKGTLEATSTNLALWNYTLPFKKQVYIEHGKAYIYEPMLNQVTIGSFDSQADFLGVLKNAKKIDENTYEATINKHVYTLKLKDSKPFTLSYTDDLGNNAIITFSNVKLNEKLDKADFDFKIPEDAEIVHIN